MFGCTCTCTLFNLIKIPMLIFLHMNIWPNCIVWGVLVTSESTNQNADYQILSVFALLWLFLVKFRKWRTGLVKHNNNSPTFSIITISAIVDVITLLATLMNVEWKKSADWSIFKWIFNDPRSDDCRRNRSFFRSSYVDLTFDFNQIVLCCLLIR